MIYNQFKYIVNTKKIYQENHIYNFFSFKNEKVL